MTYRLSYDTYDKCLRTLYRNTRYKSVSPRPPDVVHQSNLFRIDNTRNVAHGMSCRPFERTHRWRSTKRNDWERIKSNLKNPVFIQKLDKTLLSDYPLETYLIAHTTSWFDFFSKMADTEDGLLLVTIDQIRQQLLTNGTLKAAWMPHSLGTHSLGSY